MKAVIFFSGLAGLLIFGPPVLKHRSHRPEVAIHLHGHSPVQEAETNQGDCRFEAERRSTVEAGSLQEIHLVSGSGSLEVVGTPGLQEVRAVARACASHQEFLEELQLTTQTQGSALLLETRYPDLGQWRGGNRYARLDLVVEVPVGWTADIRDGSGSILVSELGPTRIQDGSGEVTVAGIVGDLIIEDGSGGLNIQGVSGSVSVRDGSGEIVLEGVGSDADIHDSSGEIHVRGVAGSLTLQDSSGEIDVADVSGAVTVVSDGSGGISVSGVGGDFTVTRDGSGEVRYSEVQGAVNIPRKKGSR